jgi:hypothetical protein
MKKVLIILLIMSSAGHAQFTDDMESYTPGEPISIGHWTDWNCGGGLGCAIISTTDQAHWGIKSGYIPGDGTTNAVLDLGNIFFDEWGMRFFMYVPSNKEASWNLQGIVPPGSGEWIVGNIFFNKDNTNSGVGFIEDSYYGQVYFNFPHDQWFSVIFIWDLLGMENAVWALYIDLNEVVPPNTPFTNSGGDIPSSLGGLNFFSNSTDCHYYIDDIEFITAVNIDIGTFSINENSFQGISIYPIPVNDLLSIDNKSNTEIISISVYDVLGRHVLTKKDNVSEIDVSHLNSGLLFVEIETDQGVITKKVVKE